MAQTLATLRGYLNDELSVATDGEAAPWTQAFRSRAVSRGYAALWRAGVWKPTYQDIATVTDQTYYTTTLRRLRVIDLVDAAGHVLDHPPGRIEPDNAGAYKLTLRMPVATGATLRVHGWTAYVSVFANDAAVDDLEDEYNRIPLLRAKAICYRKILSDFARYKTRTTTAPTMNVTAEIALGLVAAAEREWVEETRSLARLRDRAMQPRNARPL